MCRSFDVLRGTQKWPHAARASPEPTKFAAHRDRSCENEKLMIESGDKTLTGFANSLYDLRNLIRFADTCA